MRAFVACFVVLVLAACGATGPDAPRATQIDAAPSVSASASTPNDIRGRFDIGGYSLYLECFGPVGQPVVVYLHGMEGSHASAAAIPGMLADHVRWCAYDRANSGQSDRVEAVRLGSAFATELQALLAVAGVPGPYVLVGASHGGLIALEYAELYPDQVAGMVLLDGTLPHLREIYDLIPEPDRATEVAASEANPERVKVFASIDETREALDQIPDVPVTFMLAVPPVAEEPPSWPIDEIRAVDARRAREFVDRFSEGRLVTISSPHYMEPAVPNEIVAEIDRVLARIQSSAADPSSARA